MRDIGVILAGAAVIAAIVFGVVKVSEESSQGSNTRNGTTVGPPLPAGVSVDADRHADEPG